MGDEEAVAGDDPQITQLIRAIISAQPDEAARLLDRPRVLTGEELLRSLCPAGRPGPAVREALAFGPASFVERLLVAGLDAETSWGDAETALITAARHGQVDIVKLLLFHGADPRYVTDRGGSVISFSSTREVTKAIGSYREGAASRYEPIAIPDRRYKGALEYHELTVRLARERHGPREPVAVPPKATLVEVTSVGGRVLLLGVSALMIVGGAAIYAMLFVRSGSLTHATIFALAYGGALLLLLSRVLRSAWTARGAIVLGVALALGPIVGGHMLGYRFLKTMVHQTVRENAADRYPVAWQTLPRDEVYRRWLTTFTPSLDDDVLGYLRAQAAIGWTGWEGGKRLKYHTEQRGVAVWLGWLFHVVLLGGATALAHTLRGIVTQRR